MLGLNGLTNGGMKTDQLSILIVDNSDFEISTVRRWLQQIGITKIESANTTPKAARMLSKEKFDIVLCEYDLSNSTGIELLKEIRCSGRYNPCFNIMTSNSDRQTMVEILESTPDDILVKPFSPDAFMKRIVKIIKTYQYTRGIRKAISNCDYEHALRLTSENHLSNIIATNQAFSAWLERTKIEIMIKQSRMRNVEKYTDMLLENKRFDLEWVRTYNIKALLEQKSYDDVIYRSQKCLEKYPLSIKSHLFLGDAYYKKNQLKLSTKSYNRALTLSKKSITAQRAISRVHHEIGDYENALDSYKRLMQLIENSVEKKPEDFHQYANLKKESAEIKIDDDIASAVKESVNILKKGQEAFPDDIIMDVLQEVLEAQDLVHKGKGQEALRKIESTMKEFEYVINRNGAALVNSILIYQQIGKDNEVVKLKNKMEDSKSLMDIPMTTLESRFNSFKNKDKESFDKVTELLKSAKLALSNEKFDQSILYLKKAIQIAPNSLSIGFLYLEACIGKLTNQERIEKEFFTDTFSLYRQIKERIKTEMEHNQIIFYGKKLKIIKERKDIFDKENIKKLREEKEKIRQEKEEAFRQRIIAEQERENRRLEDRKQELLRQERLLKEEQAESLKAIEKESQKEQLSIGSLLKTGNVDVEAIDKIQITRSQISDNEIRLIKKLQSEKKYSELRRLTFQIKKNIYQKSIAS